LKASVFYLPSLGPRAAVQEGMAGLRPDLYRQMLSDLREQAVLADDAGYESIAFTEHHFHVEGFELSNNPVMLDLFVGLQTRRIRVGQLGIVLPASNPIRVAEDIAMLDHMTGGRAFAGFARGYQRRWVDVLAQHYYGVHGTRPGQHDQVDLVNREAFEECFRIVKLAWTEDMFSFQGKYWRIPNEGTPWDIEATRSYGAGVDSEGIVRQVGVVPKPLQKPHPPIFQPFASSERTIRWCAREGITAILPAMYDELQLRLYDVYREEAAAGGRRLRPGEGLGLLRDVIVAETDEEAYSLWRDSGAFVGAAWFAPFGFGDVLREPGRTDTPDPQELLEKARVLVGSPDTVTRQIERLLSVAPVDHLFAWNYIGFVPHAKQMRSLELFATRVLPRFA
jgi:alkanesulfonate monooxygenase SsuD/methylene tetrahydromethanopterin reductase-like flavin-dependent oxidoreductase (luciferase family)